METSHRRRRVKSDDDSEGSFSESEVEGEDANEAENSLLETPEKNALKKVAEDSEYESTEEEKAAIDTSQIKEEVVKDQETLSEIVDEEGGEEGIAETEDVEGDFLSGDPNEEEDASEEEEGEYVEEERQQGDGEECSPSNTATEKELDFDEDRRNPQYIPKKGMFYEHDDRNNEDIKEKEQEPPRDRKKKLWLDEGKWGHDRFREEEQHPKSRNELIETYGYDIRNEDGPPRARRRRRYGRGPTKYDRNWEDVTAYGRERRGGPRGISRGRRPGGRFRGGAGFRGRGRRDFNPKDSEDISNPDEVPNNQEIEGDSTTEIPVINNNEFPALPSKDASEPSNDKSPEQNYFDKNNASESSEANSVRTITFENSNYSNRNSVERDVPPRRGKTPPFSGNHERGNRRGNPRGSRGSGRGDHSNRRGRGNTRHVSPRFMDNKINNLSNDMEQLALEANDNEINSEGTHGNENNVNLSSFFTTNRRLYNYQPQIFMEGKSLPYEKHPKYLGYILDPEILSNKHIDYVINKGRKRLDLLKYIAGRDWGADAGTLRLTYTSLIRPVLEYGSQIYFSASRTNLAKLDRVQSSAARIITGMRHSCPTDLVLFEADIMPLDLRRKLLLSKYFCKLYRYGDYNRTSAYLITWTNRHRLKRDSPFSRMQAMDILDQDIEEHFLKNVFNPLEGLPRVHFKPEMGAHTSKNQDPPEYLRQLALEIINKIPATAMQIYTDGSKDEQNSCGSGIFIKAPNCSHNIKIRNSDFCSVFRSELIAIDEALRIIKTMTSPDEIWILCDSRSAIQHLSDWTNVGDKTSVSILKNLKELSQQHEIYFQWIPSHIGLFGNDAADLLAKEGVTEDLMSRRTLTFSEIFSKTKSLIQELWKTLPTHPWYNRQAPGGALSIKADRVVQTTISRLASGYIRGLSFHLGQKIYENCTKCNLVQATPDHLLFCAGLDREDIYSSPLLVYDFLRTLGLMDLV
ncbi:protein CASC3 [Trichonephila clavipes]|nr:protein CASC3 [Trichonephila clavipes]